MKIKRPTKLQVHCTEFDIVWDKRQVGGASVSYEVRKMRFGVKGVTESELLDAILHELWEVAATEMNVRLDRPDCEGEYVFVYDHRQHDTMCVMVAGWLEQFIA
jgi:hypothetical protein